MNYKTKCSLLALALATLLISGCESEEETDATAYLFTYFTDNGQDGLHLAWSPDGYHWTPLNEGESYLAPKVGNSKLMRDPCVARGPDGVYHMVWTSGWNENNIGYASTKDFISWSEQQEIPVMAHEPTVRNSWAPEIEYDEERGEFIIFWASTIPDRFPATAGASEDDYNHRMYFTTTKDFQTFSPTEIFLEPGFSVIDATFLKTDDRGLHLIIKDETRNPPKKYLQIADAESMQGPFGSFSKPFTPEGRWAEGPSAIQIGDEYLVYYDAYIERHYAAARSRDLVNWEDVTEEMTFIEGDRSTRMRHGTIIEAPMRIIEKLQSTTVTAEPPEAK